MDLAAYWVTVQEGSGVQRRSIAFLEDEGMSTPTCGGDTLLPRHTFQNARLSTHRMPTALPGEVLARLSKGVIRPAWMSPVSLGTPTCGQDQIKAEEGDAASGGHIWRKWSQMAATCMRQHGPLGASCSA